MYPHVVYPMSLGFARPLDTTEVNARDQLRGLYKVPLASENPLQFMGRALARIPRLTAIAAKSTREPPCMQSPTALAPFG
jgi:hypothetical protein